jgi:hypothetical protein
MESRRRLRQRLEQAGDAAIGRRVGAVDRTLQNLGGRACRRYRRLPLLGLGGYLEMWGRRRMLDRLFERLSRNGPAFLLRLTLGGLGRPEELRERPFTHACALSRH